MSTPHDVVSARMFLLKNKIPLDQVPPERFAAAARELDIGFSLLLRYIGRLLNSGQGMGGAPIARGIAEDAALSRAGRRR